MEGPTRRIILWLAMVTAGLFLFASCSGPATVHVPAGWKPVTYRGLTIDIPDSWPVYQQSVKPCGWPNPGVLFGAPPPANPALPSSFVTPCQPFAPIGPTVELSGPGTVLPAVPKHQEMLNGVQALVSAWNVAGGTPSGGGVVQSNFEEVVRFPGRNVFLWANALGNPLAAMPAVVDKIIDTVRPAW